MTVVTDTASQIGLFESDESLGEHPGYYRDQIITYIGNKRSLLGPIGEAISSVLSQLGKRKLRILDGFTGSGVVSRLLKSYASELVVNDLESYSRVISNCYLTNRSSIDMNELCYIVGKLNDNVDIDSGGEPGFIERLYAPKNDKHIQIDERAFYTRDNARRLDQFRQLIGTEDPAWFDLLVGPLLSSASVHANTAGVFKGFYKERGTGRGKFGGTGADALRRITGQIRLQPPILSVYEVDVQVCQMDINNLISNVGNFDLAYFDPPYNQHPYGSNYFMLNLLVDYEEPKETSRVSGIPKNWNRSAYNQRKNAFKSLSALIRNVDAKYVLLSFNNEGFVNPVRLRDYLDQLGTVKEIQIQHNTFRGRRNLHSRSTYVTEHLFLLHKQGF